MTGTGLSILASPLSGTDEPNSHQWRGKRKSKKYAHIYASCKGERLNDGKPSRTCKKCGTVSIKEEVPNLRV